MDNGKCPTIFKEGNAKKANINIRKNINQVTEMLLLYQKAFMANKNSSTRGKRQVYGLGLWQFTSFTASAAPSPI